MAIKYQWIKSQIANFMRKFNYEITNYIPNDIDPQIIKIIQTVSPFTMTSVARINSCCEAVRYIVNNNIPGAIVECGVWKGGSMMAAALQLIECHDQTRELFLYDTFEGMSEPTAYDVSVHDENAIRTWQSNKLDQGGSSWCFSPLDEVRRNVFSVGYPEHLIHFIRGKIEDTIPQDIPKSISLLRLDTDWYESTYHALKYLFPLVSNGGVILIDDYGYWKGARLATDEFLSKNNIRIYLSRIDDTGRIGIKS